MVELSTKSRVEIIDITPEVQREVSKSGARDGIVVVYTKHTTTSIIINENELGLKEDVLSLLKKIIPHAAGYRHDTIDDNADAHLRAALLGNSVVVPIENGRLELGTWQSILFVELDGPRRRNVTIKVFPFPVHEAKP
jgi:secondary thiamine-phosphate synthase enzyme